MLISYAVQGAPLTLETITHAVPFALLIASMILTNNIRDIQKDSGTRRTIAIRIGHTNATRLLITLILVTYISSILIYQTLFVLLALPVAIRLCYHFHQSSEGNPMRWAALHHALHSLFIILSLLLY